MHVVVRTRPRATPLAMITMRKSTDGFPFVSHIWDAYEAPLGGPSGRRSSAIIVKLHSRPFKRVLLRVAKNQKNKKALNGARFVEDFTPYDFEIRKKNSRS